MKRIPTFAAGMLTAAVIGTLGVGALAASGQFTISVDPINIQVDGEIFQPKDANGKDVAVFAYNGTTYAPLRALAKAYGLEVGYDAQSNMATVTAPAAPSQSPDVEPPPSAAPGITVDELKSLFKYDQMYELDGKDICNFMYCGDTPIDEFVLQWSVLNQDDVFVAITEWAKEYYGTEYAGGRTICLTLKGKSNGTTLSFASVLYDQQAGATDFHFTAYDW